MNALPLTYHPQADMSSAARAVLLTGAAGFLLANFTAQVLSAHFDAPAGSDAAAAGHSWATAVYTLSSFVGVTTARSIEQRVGTRLYFVWGALLLALFGSLQVLMPSQPLLLAMRAFEGFASGSFGPKAFLAAFMFCRGGRLSMTMALAACLLLVACVIGLVIFGASETFLGQRGLFLLQLAMGSLMALAGWRWLPPRTDMRPHPQRIATAAPPLGSSSRHSRHRRRAHARHQLSHG